MYQLLRPSWPNACGNGAFCHPSSHCAWPNAWLPSSCHPSWRRPYGARHVSWAPWYRLKTKDSKQLQTGQTGEIAHKHIAETHCTPIQRDLNLQIFERYWDAPLYQVKQWSVNKIRTPYVFLFYGHAPPHTRMPALHLYLHRGATSTGTKRWQDMFTN